MTRDASETVLQPSSRTQTSAGYHGAPEITVERVSKWFGDVVAVSQVSFAIGPGVTALLGPNGSGKTTLLKMMSGLTDSSSGSITINGSSIRSDSKLYRRIGLVPEQETIYPFLTGYEFVRLNAVMHGVSEPDPEIARVLQLVQLEDAAQRRIGEYSKGMRQRIKVASALVHDPDIVLMDEPLSGLDPRQRLRAIELIRTLGEQDKVVLVSSHLLHEVQRFAERVLVIFKGHLAAEGGYRAIRDKIDEHARKVLIVSNHPRRLAASLIETDNATATRLDSGREGGIIVESNDVRQLYKAVPKLAKLMDIRLYEIRSLDDSLASVFSYVTESAR